MTTMATFAKSGNCPIGMGQRIKLESRRTGQASGSKGCTRYGTSVQYSMDDIDPEIVLSDESVDEDGQDEDETLAEYEDDEENDVHSQEDDDMDYDM
ncbi:hypothetical protein AAC387_Pa04g2577 [Persea americana]